MSFLFTSVPSFDREEGDRAEREREWKGERLH